MENGYLLRIFVNDTEEYTEYNEMTADAELLPLKFTGTGVPKIDITMWKGSTPNTMIFDIDNYSYYCETK